MIALEGNFAYSFILGIMAAVNPCGFVLLPTYLVYYLGTELNREDENKTTTLRRGLSVGIAVSSGFIGLFLVVGIISRAFTTVISENAKYAALVIGIGLVAMGIAMLFGWKPPIAQPDVSVERIEQIATELKLSFYELMTTPNHVGGIKAGIGVDNISNNSIHLLIDKLDSLIQASNKKDHKFINTKI